MKSSTENSILVNLSLEILLDVVLGLSDLALLSAGRGLLAGGLGSTLFRGLGSVLSVRGAVRGLADAVLSRHAGEALGTGEVSVSEVKSDFCRWVDLRGALRRQAEVISDFLPVDLQSVSE